MITVRCDTFGVEVEAPSEFDALVAARTLMEEAVAARDAYTFRPTCTFLVDGAAVNGLIHVGQPAVWAALGAYRKEHECLA